MQQRIEQQKKEDNVIKNNKVQLTDRRSQSRKANPNQLIDFNSTAAALNTITQLAGKKNSIGPVKIIQEP
jgi:hypothetical protein